VSQKQPYAQSEPQIQPKKKHRARNVVLLGVFVLGVGGFASFFRSAGKASN
jgi:hypothetical protein